jgi:hypothetical protein
MEKNQPAQFHVGNLLFLLPFTQPAQGWPAIGWKKNFEKFFRVHQLDGRIDVFHYVTHARG